MTARKKNNNTPEHSLETGVLHEEVKQGIYKPAYGHSSNGIPKLRAKSVPMWSNFVNMRVTDKNSAD